MNRWSVGLIIALLWAVGIVATRSTSPHLLRDTDTKVMLQRIEARNNPLSWFTGDWPLENHFYRPVVAETFELDHKIYGWKSEGYGLTNAILCGLCVLSLFWFLRELTGHFVLTTTATSLFGLWHLFANPPPDWAGYLSMILIGISGLTLLANLVFRTRPILSALFATAVALILGKEWIGLEQFRGGMIDWVPGRTASTMTVFCLLSLAAYARYERVSARKDEPDPGPLDPPATRGTAVVKVIRWPWVWAVVAAVCTFLALASYEQAVMLPACLLGVAIAMRLQHYRVRWGWAAAFWGVLLVYLVLRSQVIPPGTSGYQAQQFRTGGGVYITLTSYLFPSSHEVVALATGAELGFVDLLIAQYADIIAVLANVAFLAGLTMWARKNLKRKDRTRVVALLFALVASLITFLPMAWLKPFSGYNHYHYWPLAMRALFVAGLFTLFAEWLTDAWSRRALQAPQRLAPAPGSLPHP